MKTIIINNNKQTSGKNLLDYLRTIGISMIAPCGGRGLCGKCKVKIIKGNNLLTTPYSGSEVISQEEWIEGYRLACGITIQEDMHIQLEDTHNTKANILTDGYFNTSLNPIVKKKYFSIDKPAIQDQRPDTDRIESTVGDINVLDINLIKELPDILNKYDYNVTLVYTMDEIIAVEGKDTTNKFFGLAVDIGTTTIAGVLINLCTGEEVGVYSSINPQKLYGDDVISRIDYTINNTDGLVKLTTLVINELNDMLMYFENKYNIKSKNIYHIGVVGNTIMMHILVGASVEHIAASPFNPVFSRLKHINAGELGLNIHSKGLITSFPLSAGYIGADTLSCIIACGMAARQELSLMIDIGTNGEIALGNKEKIVTCAAAAGPAFEGGHIECGMGGIAGAINTAKIDDQGIKYTTIDNDPVRGICGSGLVDLLRWMLDYEIVESSGRLITYEEGSARFSQNIAQNIKEYKGKPSFVLSGKLNDTDKNIYITQKDIREVQLAKAAIAAGVKVLINDLGVSYDEIDRVYLAGGFGNYINIESAVKIGLIPYELKDRIYPIGNAALSGAKMSVMSYEYINEAEKISQLIEYIELSTRADFQEHFIDNIEFKKEA